MTNIEVIKSFLQGEKAQTGLREIVNGYYMYKATLIDKSKELKCYHIHTKYSGESVPKEVITIIK